MQSIKLLIVTVIQLYIYVIIAQVIVSWLIGFNVVNLSNQFVRAIAETLYRLTEPVYRPIRNVLPSLGAIDISPLVAVLLLMFFQNLLFEYWPR